MTKLTTTADVKKMVEAMKLCPTFKIEQTPETVIVTHTSGRVVFRALLKGSGSGAWIVRHVNNLFN